MRGVTHLVIGANSIWIPALLGVTVPPWLIAVPAFTSLLPDLDASESMIKHMTVGGYFGKTKIGIKPFYLVAFIFSKLFGHRGVLHSFVALALVAIGAYLLIPFTSTTIFALILLGYASHLAGDALTKSGIEIFWPNKKNYGLLPREFRIKTGGIVDTILLLAGSFGVIAFLYMSVKILG